MKWKREKKLQQIWIKSIKNIAFSVIKVITLIINEK